MFGNLGVKIFFFSMYERKTKKKKWEGQTNLGFEYGTQFGARCPPSLTHIFLLVECACGDRESSKSWISLSWVYASHFESIILLWLYISFIYYFLLFSFSFFFKFYLMIFFINFPVHIFKKWFNNNLNLLNNYLYPSYKFIIISFLIVLWS